MAVERESRGPSAEWVLPAERTIPRDASPVISTRRWAWEWTKSILVAFALFLVIRSFLIEAFRIPTGSMEGTLLVGDFLLVNKAVFGARVPLTNLRLPAFDRPTSGDIIVFVPPHEPGRNYVKRLIGLAGDTLQMKYKVLYINGRAQDESYIQYTDPSDAYSPQMRWQCEFALAADARPCRPMRDNWGPLVVPAGRVLVLGDNRDDSEDSRYWGFVSADAIKGRPLFVYYSFEPASARPLPWLSHIRWGRIGETVH